MKDMTGQLSTSDHNRNEDQHEDELRAEQRVDWSVTDMELQSRINMGIIIDDGC